MRDRSRGAQRASVTTIRSLPVGARRRHAGVPYGPALEHRSRHRPLMRAVALMILVALVAATGLLTAPTAARAADAPPKAVIIVGPASSSTARYLAEGEQLARSAEAEGMDVRRIFTPRATWARVKANIQGAKLVAYLGHGNGWPSPHAPFQGQTKDGFGLNPCENDCGTTAPAKYYGESFIRSEIELAPKAVVLLQGLCYASGNAESDMAPVFDRELATKRVSNFAAGFLDAGAAAVFALGWPPRVDLPDLLMRSSLTMDEIFELPASDFAGAYDGFIGNADYYRDSTRTPGARIHLDPHPRIGHERAVTGDLSMTATAWRDEPPPPDETAPRLVVRAAGTTDDPAMAAADERVVFTPNEDGSGDRLVIDERLSEPATVLMEVRNEAGDTVLSVKDARPQGDGRITWDGRNEAGNVVRDGDFEVELTPRDAAGNVGRGEVVRVRVLTALTKVRPSATGLSIRDRDRLGDEVMLATRLLAPATVSWRIARDGGKVVATRFDDRTLKPGRITWRWDGRDDRGRLVPDGDYTATIVAVTAAGTLRYAVPLHVGALDVNASTREPRRGTNMRLIVTSPERLRGKVTVEVRFPGLRAPVTVKMPLSSPYRATSLLRIPAKAEPGIARVTITGTDARGGRQTERITLDLR